jgi:hypothetical protein
MIRKAQKFRKIGLAHGDTAVYFSVNAHLGQGIIMKSPAIDHTQVERSAMTLGRRG